MFPRLEEVLLLFVKCCFACRRALVPSLMLLRVGEGASTIRKKYLLRAGSTIDVFRVGESASTSRKN